MLLPAFSLQQRLSVGEHATYFTMGSVAPPENILSSTVQANIFTITKYHGQEI
jgi:hypothetical protein